MSTSPSSTPISRLPDRDMQGAPAALLRAAQRAREVAIRTGTPLVVVKDGKVIEETVTQEQHSPS